MNKITSIATEDCRRIIDEAKAIVVRRAREAEENRENGERAGAEEPAVETLAAEETPQDVADTTPEN